MHRRLSYMLSMASAVMVAFALSAAAQAPEYYPHGGALDAHKHGYEHGYRDGFERGREARAHNASSDFHTEDFERADRGYEAYFGDHEAFRDGYRDGYRTGYADGFNGNRGRFDEVYGYRGRDYDADRDRVRDRDDAIYGERHWGVRDVASDIAYRDGLAAGAKDASTGHSFRPHEHDSWKDGNHGYVGAYGSRDVYKREYRASYDAGYSDGYGGRR